MNIYFVKSNATKPCLRVSLNRAKHSYISNIAAKYEIWENITLVHAINFDRFGLSTQHLEQVAAMNKQAKTRMISQHG